MPSRRPRYRPDVALPPYRYVPGRAPHPTRDPGGHSHPAAPPPAGRLLARDVAADPGFRFGVDLYNHGYHWEAHETWEAAWRRTRRGSHARLAIQGLIQVAAGELKRATGEDAGGRRLVARGLAKLDQAGAALPSVHLAPFAASHRDRLARPGDGDPATVPPLRIDAVLSPGPRSRPRPRR